MQPGNSFSHLSLWHRAILCLSLCMTLSLPVHGWAANGRDFAGFYSLSNAVDVGGQMQLTLSARIFNYSGADVGGATIAVEDRMLPGTSYASFPGLAMAVDGNLTVSGQVTLPVAEYQRWQTGTQPRLRIEYLNASGGLIRQPIELSPSLPGVQP